jgi:hypothetical protein
MSVYSSMKTHAYSNIQYIYIYYTHIKIYAHTHTHTHTHTHIAGKTGGEGGAERG